MIFRACGGDLWPIIAFGIWIILIVGLLIGTGICVHAHLYEQRGQQQTPAAKAATAWTRIDWEIADDFGTILPLDVLAHHGHRVVALWVADSGWDFNNWYCIQCQQGWGSTYCRQWNDRANSRP